VIQVQILVHEAICLQTSCMHTCISTVCTFDTSNMYIYIHVYTLFIYVRLYTDMHLDLHAQRLKPWPLGQPLAYSNLTCFLWVLEGGRPCTSVVLRDIIVPHDVFSIRPLYVWTHGRLGHMFPSRETIWEPLKNSRSNDVRNCSSGFVCCLLDCRALNGWVSLPKAGLNRAGRVERPQI
jgi:hypothetical protein